MERATPKSGPGPPALLCRPCRGHLCSVLIDYRARGETVANCEALARLINASIATDNVAACSNQGCASAQQVQAQELEALLHQNTCSSKSGQRVCDCADTRISDAHKEILGYVHKIHTCATSLSRARSMLGRGHTLSQTTLHLMPGHWENLRIKEDAAQLARPLCLVPSAAQFHCHSQNLQSYAPDACECVPEPCACLPCILEHVKHSLRDYEEAISRVTFGITELSSFAENKPKFLYTPPAAVDDDDADDQSLTDTRSNSFQSPESLRSLSSLRSPSSFHSASSFRSPSSIQSIRSFHSPNSPSPLRTSYTPVNSSGSPASNQRGRGGWRHRGGRNSQPDSQQTQHNSPSEAMSAETVRQVRNHGAAVAAAGATRRLESMMANDLRAAITNVTPFSPSRHGSMVFGEADLRGLGNSDAAERTGQSPGSPE